MSKTKKNGDITNVIGKTEMIKRTKELFEKGLIRIDLDKNKQVENLIIGCDFGEGKDFSAEWIHYR